MMMTSKERVLNALNRKPTDRVPFATGFGMNQPVIEDLSVYLGKSESEVRDLMFGLSDMRWISPKYTGPQDRVCQVGREEIDVWGVPRHKVSYGRGYYQEISRFILGNIETIEELESYTFPDVSWFDYSSISEQMAKHNDKNEYAIYFTAGNMFESAWYMRGFEQMFMDMYLNPELYHAIMEKVTDYFLANAKCMFEHGNGLIDIAFTADDIGQQQGLLLSMEMFEEFIKPYHVKLNKVLHEYGMKVMFHTDGAVMDALESLIDMGVDILEALQFDAKGMDPVLMAERCGDRLCYHGGISVQKTLPHGSVQEVRDEVRHRIRVLGKNGGYIVAPSHCIQAGTPPENVVAFFEEATGVKIK